MKTALRFRADSARFFARIDSVSRFTDRERVSAPNTGWTGDREIPCRLSLMTWICSS